MPYTLLFRIVGPLVLVGLVVGGIWGYGHKRYVAGKDEVRAEWDAAKAAALEAQREIERMKRQSNQGVTDDYRKQAVAANAAAVLARADADGVRSELASRAADPGAGFGPDESAATARSLGECIAEYQALAESADRVTNQTIGLQSYVAKVCLADK
jgi:hypothetical protein